MTASDLIESYVAEVAVQLPRRQRNDVAFELRALLSEELQAKSEEAGHDVDVAMATELLRAFGRPSDVAARYLPTLTIVDPADGHRFLRATVVGLAIIWVLGLLKHLRPIDSGWDLLTVLGPWWTGTVIPSMWWPGVLVVGFGLSAWVRRRWPQASEWKPRTADQIHGGRAALVMAIVGIVCGLSAVVDPRWVLDIAFGGRAAPAAYEALTYTEAFRQRQGPILFVLLASNIPLMIAVIVSGRWSAVVRRVEAGLQLAICAVLVWIVLDGPVFMASASDRAVKFAMALTVVLTLVYMGMELHRSVRPAPSREIQG